MTAAIKVVPANRGVQVVASGPIVHLCPHVEEVDNGAAEIRWTTGGEFGVSDTVELHSLAEFLKTAYADQKISHEDLALDLALRFEEMPGISGVCVTLTFTTAGLEATAVVDCR